MTNRGNAGQIPVFFKYYRKLVSNPDCLIMPKKGTLFLFSILLIISGCATEPHVVKHADLYVNFPEKIYVVDHGWHTGFVVPTDIIESELPQLEDRFGDKPYLEFGWGDKGFYEAQEITTGITLWALFWPTDSVIHAVAVPENPHTYFPSSEVKDICLNGKQYTLLISYIVHSFYTDQHNHIVKLKKGIYGDSQFYKANGHYYFMNTCNKWTAKGLQSAGFNISPTFKLTASSIMNYLSGNNAYMTSQLCNAKN